MWADELYKYVRNLSEFLESHGPWLEALKQYSKPPPKTGWPQESASVAIIGALTLGQLPWGLGVQES